MATRSASSSVSAVVRTPTRSLDMKTMAQVDQAPRLAGNTMHMVLSPLPAQQRVKKFTAHLDKDFDSEDSAFDAEDDE